MAHSESLALFLPAYNEVNNIRRVVQEAVAHLSRRGHRYWVIVVDDGSTDATGAVLRGVMVEFPDVVSVVTHEVNKGYGAALRTGFQAGLATGAEWIAFCDADGQFRVSDVDLLFEAIQRDSADVAIGYRRVRVDSLRRRLMGRAWHLASSALLGFSARDVDCGFKLFSRASLAALAPRLVGGYATVSPELLARASRMGLSIAQTGVRHYPREHGDQTGAHLSVILGSFRSLAEVRSALSQP